MVIDSAPFLSAEFALGTNTAGATKVPSQQRQHCWTRRGSPRPSAAHLGRTRAPAASSARPWPGELVAAGPTSASPRPARRRHHFSSPITGMISTPTSAASTQARRLERRRAEDGVHERQVDEADLEQKDRADADEDPGIAVEPHLQDRFPERAAVQQVEDLEEDDRGDGLGLRLGIAERPRSRRRSRRDCWARNSAERAGRHQERHARPFV